MLAKFESGYFLEVIINEKENLYEYFIYDKIRNLMDEGTTELRDISLFVPMNEIDYIITYCLPDKYHINKILNGKYNLISFNTMEQFETCVRYVTNSKLITKDEAIKRHREMWTWIAEQLESDRLEKNISFLKEEYCKKNNMLSLTNHCFCCEYSMQLTFANHCKHCPLIWGTEKDTKGYYCENGLDPTDYEIKSMDDTGLWMIASYYAHKFEFKTAAKYARKIANLPERENQECDYYFLEDK